MFVCHPGGLCRILQGMYIGFMLVLHVWFFLCFLCLISVVGIFRVVCELARSFVCACVCVFVCVCVCVFLFVRSTGSWKFCDEIFVYHDGQLISVMTRSNPSSLNGFQLCL